MKKQKEIPARLTDVEFELMNILWKIKEGSVADVMAQLSKERDLAYTSVSTILRILEQKNILAVRKEGRGHIYIPVLLRSDYESRTINDVVDRVFDGTPTSLVRQLLESRHLGENELSEIKKILTEYGGKK